MKPFQGLNIESSLKSGQAPKQIHSKLPTSCLNLSCILRPVQIRQRRQEEKATSCLDTVQTKPFAESCHSEKVNFPTEQEIEPTDQTSLSIHTSSRSTPRVQGAHVL